MVALETNKGLAIIQLEELEICHAELRALAKALKTNQTLTTLHFGCFELTSGIDAEGAKILAEGLETNVGLTTLYLGHSSDIGYVGVQALAKALETNQSLTTLDLHNSYFGYGVVMKATQARKP